jgi:hypothetical protein
MTKSFSFLVASIDFFHAANDVGRKLVGKNYEGFVIDGDLPGAIEALMGAIDKFDPEVYSPLRSRVLKLAKNGAVERAWGVAAKNLVAALIECHAINAHVGGKHASATGRFRRQSVL